MIHYFMKNFEKTDEIDVLKELSSLDIAEATNSTTAHLTGLAAVPTNYR